MVVIFLLWLSAHAFTANYSNHKVLRLYPNSSLQVSTLRELSGLPHTPEDFDFWLEPGIPLRPVDIRVSPSYLATLVQYLQSNSLEFSVSVEDVQQVFEDARRPSNQDGQWDLEYHPLQDIQNWLKAAAQANPSFVKLVQIGTTYENRTVFGLTISKAPAGSPQIYIDGGIHAREWLSPAVVQYLIGQFVNHTSDSRIANCLAKIEWTFVPVWNADGYSYTWTNDPNWRKNRQPTKNSPCIGTDICRNFPAGWGNTDGSSSNPCADDYHGVAAWSAPEAAILREYVAQSLPRLKGYINFHSYAELWLTNYGYTRNLPADYDTQEATAKKITDAIRAVHGQQYGYGPAYTTIYPAAGIPSDWTYDALKVVFSQAVELRGNSFQPPPSIILPTGEEIIAGVFELVNAILGN